MLNTHTSFLISGSSNRRPIRRFVAYSVFWELVTACRLAGVPTILSPSDVKATTDGVVRAPSLFSSTLGFLPSITETHEFVVPRSMPMTWPLTLSDLQQTKHRTVNKSSTITMIIFTVLSSKCSCKLIQLIWLLTLVVVYTDYPATKLHLTDLCQSVACTYHLHQLLYDHSTFSHKN